MCFKSKLRMLHAQEPQRQAAEGVPRWALLCCNHWKSNAYRAPGRRSKRLDVKTWRWWEKGDLAWSASHIVCLQTLIQWYNDDISYHTCKIHVDCVCFLFVYIYTISHYKSLSIIISRFWGWHGHEVLACRDGLWTLVAVAQWGREDSLGWDQPSYAIQMPMLCNAIWLETPCWFSCFNDKLDTSGKSQYFCDFSLLPSPSAGLVAAAPVPWNSPKCLEFEC